MHTEYALPPGSSTTRTEHNNNSIHTVFLLSLFLRCLHLAGTWSTLAFQWQIRMLQFGTEQSFRKARWLPQARILELKPQLLRNFIQRRHDGSIDEFGDLVNGIHPDSLLVERVIAQKSTLHGQHYLTKWRSLAYSESTWEPEEDLKDDKVGCE